MLDPDDEQIVKDAKEGGGVLVTWDKVVREAAGGMTPYEALEMAKTEGEGPPAAQAEVSRLLTLKPEDLTSLSEAADKTAQVFREHIVVDSLSAEVIRHLRVHENYSWRAIARHFSERLQAPWGSNQLAGMALCEKAAKVTGENFLEPPWN